MTGRSFLRKLYRDCRGNGQGVQALLCVPVFAGMIGIGAYGYQREAARSEMAGEVRRQAWGMALGSCQGVAGGAAAIQSAAQESFGVGLEQAVRSGKLEPHVGEADVTLQPRYATTLLAREVTRPAFLGGGIGRVSSTLGVACNTLTGARNLTKELHDVFKHFLFLFGG
jgi:hypothetical protein